MRKIITLGRVQTDKDIQRALKQIEDTLNRLASPLVESDASTAQNLGGAAAGGGLVSVGPQGPAGAAGATGAQGPAGASGVTDRNEFFMSTAPLASGATERSQVDFARTATLLAILPYTICRVVFYSSLAAQIADTGRGLGFPAPVGQGILAEFAFGSLYQIECAPRPSIGNTEPPVASSTLYYAITNRSLVTTPVILKLLRVPQETSL